MVIVYLLLWGSDVSKVLYENNLELVSTRAQDTIMAISLNHSYVDVTRQPRVRSMSYGSCHVIRNQWQLPAIWYGKWWVTSCLYGQVIYSLACIAIKVIKIKKLKNFNQVSFGEFLTWRVKNTEEMSTTLQLIFY